MIGKKVTRRIFLSFLSFALAFTSIDAVALPVNAQGNALLEELQVEKIFLEEVYELGVMETSAPSMGFFSLADGVVEPTESAEVLWIDRIKELPDSVRDMYDALVEGADHDGEEDFLIDASNYTEDHSIPAVQVSGEMENPTQEKLQAVMEQVYASYEMYVCAAACAFDRDHPEVFWLSGAWEIGCSASCEYDYEDGVYNYTVTLDLILKDSGSDYDVRQIAYRDQAALEASIAQRDQIAADILNATSGMDDYRKIQYFNKVLTESNEYNTSADLQNIAPACRECTSALAGSYGTSGPVCEGYARAFKVLCDEAGIPCVLVDGAADNGSGNPEAHMWNYVKLDGIWYAVDVTWNDPLVYGASGVVSGYELEDWLLVGGETVIKKMKFLTSHPVSNQPATGLAFPNGPELSAAAYVPVKETTLSDIETNTANLTYGEKLTITVKAATGERVATDQKMSLYFGDTELASDSVAENGVYTLTYDTAQRKVPVGEEPLTLKFSGGIGMSEAEANVQVTLNPATPVVQFTASQEEVTYTSAEAQITAPKVSLLSNDTNQSEIQYFYKEASGTDAFIQGLPVDVGTYTVKAKIGESADGYYTVAESTNQLTLTISQKPLTIKATNQSIAYGTTPVWGIADVTAPALGVNDALASIQMRMSVADVTQEGTLTPYQAVIKRGEADVTNNYVITYETGTLTITPYVLTEGMVTLGLPEEGYVYDGQEKKPAVTVVDGASTLEEGKDYQISYKNHIAAGENTAAVTVTGCGDYAGEVKLSYTIRPADYEVQVQNSQTIDKGSRVFAEPAFTGVNGEPVAGTLVYATETTNHMSAGSVQQLLAGLDGGQSCVLTYTFTPDAGGNYAGVKSGQIVISVAPESDDDAPGGGGTGSGEGSVNGGGSTDSGSEGGSSSIAAPTCTKGQISSNCSSRQFKDLDLTQWYHLDVDFVVANGIMNGTSATTFSPATITNRAMIVTILYRMSGDTVSQEALARCNFSDVPAGQYYTEAVAWAASKGVVNGVSATEFAPNAPITREQMMSMLYRYAGNYLKMDTSERKPLTAFADHEMVSAYAVEALEWAYAIGMTTGSYSGDKLIVNPQGQTPRDQAAAFIHRFSDNLK